MYKVYCVTNLINGSKYIGFTSKDIYTRFEWHCTRNNCTRIHNAINKYGRENFKIEIIANFVNREDALKFETSMILGLNTLSPNGYNLSTGGESPTLTEESRLKMSKSQKARPNRPPMSKEQKLKISKTRLERGIKISKESILKGIETKKKNNKPLPEDFGKKISERQVGKNNPTAKAIRCLNDEKYFHTTKEASDYYKIPAINITAVLKKRNKCTGVNKLKFEYVTTNIGE